MLLPLFAQVELTEDIPEYNLKKGSVGIIVEHYPMGDNQEDGYSIEGLIYQDTVEVSESQISLVTEKSTENKVFV
ncbi:DUF4926 domain-containing protein [Geminocystis herdmanii]|uniref:DUF4926 domain-containing protein n=1 Tax=Geminocystis herdmanii TaxID=669359 RepID=UPI00034CB6EC|nr:DUF4926 domain-containing protein [Geminocystis herdmanii]